MKLLVLFLDAFGFNHLTKEKTPFIYSLAKEGQYGNLKTLPGYHVEYSMLSGAYPSKHNVWIWYYLDPENSAFKWIKKYNFLFKHLEKWGLKKSLRRFITYYTCLKRAVRGHTRMLKINQIPLDKAPLFNISINKSYIDKNPMNVPTLFDILRQNKKTYLASEYPILSTHKKTRIKLLGKKDKHIFKYFIKNINKDYDLLYLHVWNLDSITHKHGLTHQITLDYLKEMDNNVKTLVESSKEKLAVVIFSDHGMIPVTNTINPKEIINSLGISNIEMFIGSTTVQLWTKDESSIKKIKDEFNSLNCEVFDRDNVRKVFIPYKREFVGDLLIVAKPGYQFYPDYYRDTIQVAAMHGYMQHPKELDGIFIVNSPDIIQRKINNASLIDLTPTILKLMNLPIPKTCDGNAKI